MNQKMGLHLKKRACIFYFFEEAILTHRNSHRGESNLRPWEEHTSRTQANNTRPIQVGLRAYFFKKPSLRWAYSGQGESKISQA